MPSEELEKSLRDEVNNYIESRLSAMREEITRLQGEINESFTRLSERASDENQADAPLAVAVAEHIRAAHERGVTEAAAESQHTRASSDIALLKSAIDDIDDQRSQADILNMLINQAASFAPRVAFFVIKQEQAIGWRARGLEGTVGDNAVREIVLPLTSETVISEVARSRATWSGAPGSKAEDHLLTSKLGPEPPERMVAVPLVVRGRAVAVLYADSAALDDSSINLEVLEMLVRVAGMAVELLAVPRAAPAERPAHIAQEPQPAAQTETQTAEQPAPQVEETATEEEAPPAAETAQPQAVETHAPTAGTDTVEVQPSEIPTQASEIPEEAAPAPTPSWEPVYEYAETPSAPQESAPAEVEASATSQYEVAPGAHVPEAHAPAQSESMTTPGAFAPQVKTPAPQVAEQPGASDEPAHHSSEPSSSGFAAPLGAARTYGSTDSSLPVDVGDEEKRLHNDARRFARLLVSEIKLYNEQKVRDGRMGGDIYDRLREDIDRSRQMYDKRVAPPVAARFDYFHQELVSTLAEGDPSKLGANYPGASLSA